MLKLAEHDPVTGLQVRSAPTLRDKVDPLSRAARENDFIFGSCADEGRHPFARRFKRERHIGRPFIHAPVDGGIVRAACAHHRIKHNLRLLRGGGGVEIVPAVDAGKVSAVGGGNHRIFPSSSCLRAFV